MNIRWNSPVWFVPVGVGCLLVLIQSIHISMHSQYCKTEAQWLNEQEGMTYDRESSVK